MDKIKKTLNELLPFKKDHEEIPMWIKIKSGIITAGCIIVFFAGIIFTFVFSNPQILFACPTAIVVFVYYYIVHFLPFLNGSLSIITGVITRSTEKRNKLINKDKVLRIEYVIHPENDDGVFIKFYAPAAHSYEKGNIIKLYINESNLRQISDNEYFLNGFQYIALKESYYNTDSEDYDEYEENKESAEATSETDEFFDDDL